MTIETTQIKQIYAGNGLARVFPVPFPFARPADLRLVRADAGGPDTPITDNFSVTITPAGETSLTYPLSGAALPAGSRLIIYRDTPELQIVDLVYGGDFNPEVLEHDGYDRAVMMIQELREAVDRSLKVSMWGDKTPEERMQEILDAINMILRAEEAANRAENAAEKVELAKAARNIRRSWTAKDALPSGGILELPSLYYPGMNILLLMHRGAVCCPKNSFLSPGAYPEYEEIGVITQPSRQVRVWFPVEAGDELSMWVIAPGAWAVVAQAMEHRDTAALYAGQVQNSATAAANSAYAASQSAVEAADSADQAQAAVKSVQVVTTDKNYRVSWVAASAISSGTLITIPENVSYFPGVNMLHLAHNGAECNPAQDGLTT
ncbi:MAG: hypothetical protein LBJ82_06830, partial [Deltaproteobacteria bacterium]|nr:hypothetical protein [Deltaproteobacteria bacterium]